jgi:hypothetical protein
MRKLYFPVILSFIFILAAEHGLAQMYQDINAGLVPAGRSVSTWADYDEDGDLDLLVSGISTADTRVSKIYRNDGGDFIDIEAGLPGLKESTADWGDFDNDGDLDFVLAGNGDDGDVAMIFRNDEGVFNDIGAGLPMISNGDARWGDFDNDSDLDLFLTGNWMGKIYRNDDGTFVDDGQDFGYWSSSSIDWGDFDNDGDMDILLIGDSGAGAKSIVFVNVAGTFSESLEIQLPGLMAGTAHWIDFDTDGDLDISISGFDDALEANFKLFENQGDGSFEQFFAGIEGVALSGVDWGDYDNDGDLDIILTGNGTGCGVIVSGIYRNDGDYFVKQGTSFTTALRADLQWADYDNDGDLDFVISGLTYSDNPFTKIYRNTEGMNLFQANTAPEHPQNVNVEIDGNMAVFSWDKGSDLQTSADALSYNLMIGTRPGGDDVLPCLSHAENGNRKVIRLGNMNQDTSWCIVDLEPGTYHYAVQTVDQGFRGSEFSPEHSFDIIATGIGDGMANSTSPGIFPNPASDHIVLEDATNELYTITLLDLNGRQHLSAIAPAGKRIHIPSSMAPGIYVARIKGADQSIFTRRVIIR